MWKMAKYVYRTEHGLTRSELEPTIYHTQGEHANDYGAHPARAPPKLEKV
jgi:hypothetical protein